MNTRQLLITIDADLTSLKDALARARTVIAAETETIERRAAALEAQFKRRCPRLSKPHALAHCALGKSLSPRAINALATTAADYSGWDEERWKDHARSIHVHSLKKLPGVAGRTVREVCDWAGIDYYQ